MKSLLTIEDIRNLGPCYDPSKYLPEDWQGTVLDVLHLEECPVEDRLWVSLRLAPRFIVECFAIDCALRAASDAAAAAADYASYAAVYVASYADYASYAADCAADAYAAKGQERENQIDSLIMLLEGEE